MKIVPHNRLLFFFGTICFSFSLMAVLFPDYSMLSYGIICFFIALAIVDSGVSFGALQGLVVSLPEVTRMSKGRESEILIRITSDEHSSRKLTIGLALPAMLHSEKYEARVVLPGPESSTFSWKITGLKQGRYHLDKCYLEKQSLFGFWLIRGTQSIDSEIRVYPDLFTEQKTLAAIFKNNGMGLHIQRFIGKGREFEKLRDYVAGDSVEDIHWKATAKRGVPVSKVYQIERTQDIYLMIDASRMSARNAGVFSSGHLRDEKRNREESTPSLFSKDTILDRYITSSLTLGLAAEKQGDNFGVGIFSDQVSRFIKAKSGKMHFNACRDMLYTVEPHRVSPDYSEFFSFSGTRIRKRSLMIVLTSLDDPVLSENFLANIHMLSRRHLVLVCMLNPVSASSLFSSENVTSVNDIYQNLAGHSLWSSLRETERNLYRHGAGFCLLDNRQMSLQLISHYIDIKRRQLI